MSDKITWCEHNCMGELLIPSDCICVEIVKLMKHFIGLDYKNPYKRHGKSFYKPYRNFFASAEGCDGYEKMLFLIEQGFARMDKNKTTFYLTRKGMDWLGELICVKIHDPIL